MIDLYTALKLCSGEPIIKIDNTEYMFTDIPKKFDLRNTKVVKIYFDLWDECIVFKTVKSK